MSFSMYDVIYGYFSLNSERLSLSLSERWSLGSERGAWAWAVSSERWSQAEPSDRILIYILWERNDQPTGLETCARGRKVEMYLLKEWNLLWCITRISLKRSSFRCLCWFLRRFSRGKGFVVSLRGILVAKDWYIPCLFPLVRIWMQGRQKIFYYKNYGWGTMEDPLMAYICYERGGLIRRVVEDLS